MELFSGVKDHMRNVKQNLKHVYKQFKMSLIDSKDPFCINRKQVKPIFNFLQQTYLNKLINGSY